MSDEDLPQDPQNENGAESIDSKNKTDQKAYFTDFFKELINLNIGSDKVGTIKGIRSEVDFKGANIWILICSIFIASIGLNINSTAVVIGAMLISPLMGPILGMGLALGINDWALLKRSLKSISIATIVSLLTAAIFFYISPLKSLTSELGGRTSPHLYDAFIAFFGGLAGIIGVSRKNKSNVIPGVAIATALMPPLCTAGYGLSTGQFSYFLGAFYLFCLNTIFICVATFLIVRFLKFPLKHFVDSKRESLVKRYMAISVVLILLPSGYLFYRLAGESKYEAIANEFIHHNIAYKDAGIAKQTITYGGDTNLIEIVFFGEQIPISTIRNWEKSIEDTDGLEHTHLHIIQGKDMTADIEQMEKKIEESNAKLYEQERTELESELLSTSQALLEEQRISDSLTEQILTWNTTFSEAKNIEKEIKVLFPDVSEVKSALVSDTLLRDTVMDIRPKQLYLLGVGEMEASARQQLRENILQWLKVRKPRSKLDIIMVPE